jgi:hypothetical protein
MPYMNPGLKRIALNLAIAWVLFLGPRRVPASRFAQF